MSEPYYYRGANEFDDVDCAELDGPVGLRDRSTGWREYLAWLLFVLAFVGVVAWVYAGMPM